MTSLRAARPLRRRALGAALATIATLGVATAAAQPASAAKCTKVSPAAEPSGTTSLASVLLADKDEFDKNWKDYDIVTQAVLAVLAAKPSSPVSVLTKGDVALTAFIPDDRAFRALVKDLTGKAPNTEKAVFAAVAGLGIDTVETVLLYHVVPGATIDSKTALGADGAALTTAQGGKITVDVRGNKSKVIVLVDADTDDLDPRVSVVDINKGNKQIAHGISRVLRPVNL
ncbi:MAG: fasciclin domain-containing protein [Kineosporiaceae bacterium]